MASIQKIAPCLWFDSNGEEAARFYTSIFKNSKINKVARYPAEGKEIHGKDAGKVMTVQFELDGQSFTALNGGPMFKFNEAVSFQIFCENQDEIDYFWTKLGEGGEPKAQQCGWLKDKFGLSWQVVPRQMAQLFEGGDPAKAGRVMKVMLK
jgi:predicted 3-demethylubiquinone-9 3-methyltransferase (glyoxalase superfamily)